MESSPQHIETVHGLLQRVLGFPLEEQQIEHRHLRGGLEAGSVMRVTARFRCAAGVVRRRAFVLKQLNGEADREAYLYSMLQTNGNECFAPQMHGVHEWEGRRFLFLEAIRPVRAWPWRDHAASRQVMLLLARLHETVPPGEDPEFSSWDYDASLAPIAALTVQVLEGLPKNPLLAPLKKQLPALRRVAASLPAMRQQLLAWQGFGSTFIHGDVHPGNVLICRRGGREEPRLLDWARARVGSPLEDVSSWLQSLSYWEPEARRRHDSLFSDYLAARGFAAGMTPSIREGYWFAGASNALSGALLHHLHILSQAEGRHPRALDAARDWLRIIRRADDCWRGGLN